MKKAKKVLGFIGLLFLSGNALAGNGHFYIGAAFNLQDCANRAGANGYAYGVFGPGFDDNGIYYNYYNACFGTGKNGNGGSHYSYDVYIRNGFTQSQCISDIEWSVNNVNCRADRNNADIVECKASQNQKISIQAVNCVSRVYQN
jgi:hypothetical protein